MLLHVEQHAAALDAMPRHVLDAQVPGAELPVARLARVVQQLVAVVLHDLLDPVAVGIEHAAHVRKAVPLRGMLIVEQHRIVGDDLRAAGIETVDASVEQDHAVPHDRLQHRRLATRICRVGLGHVKRQAETEPFAGLDLPRRLDRVLFGQVVQTAQLVVRPEIAPVRPRRPVLPFLRHLAQLQSG